MAQPPPRVETRYYQPADYNLGLSIGFIIVDVLAVALRVGARKKKKLSLQSDDWLIFPALIFTIGSAAAMIHSKADLDASLEQIHIVSKTEFAMNLLIPALCFIKLSFLAFYKRIFCVHKSGAIQNGINAMMGLIVAWSVAYWFAHLFMCGTNFSAFWSSFEDLRMKCINTLQMLYSFTVTDFITDVFILVIPMPSLWHLQLQPAKKVAVTVVFVLGSSAVAASATRLAFAVQAVNQGFDVEDGNLVITGMMSWFQLEAFFGILAACLPTVRFLFKGLSPESVIDSIRSTLSLHSLRSNHSQINGDGIHPQHEIRLEQADSKNSHMPGGGIVSPSERKHARSSERAGSLEV